MQYQSTRGASLGRFSDILLQGLAPDGGLAMPEHIPTIITAKTLREWKTLSYADLAFAVMRHYIDDIPENDLRRNRCTEIRQYIAEQIAGHNDLKAPRILDEEHARSIDEKAVRLHVWVFPTDLCEDFIPEHHRVAQCIPLGD